MDLDKVNDRVMTIVGDKADEYGIRVVFENRISKDIDGNSTIYTQKQYFKELVINLLTNGIKYNNPGGFVKVIYDEDDTNYIVTVEDNGIGISEDEKERIFERFYRVSKSRNKDIDGTGLGLAIVKHILISLGGSIEVESEPQKGSKFTIILPKNKTVFLA